MKQVLIIPLDEIKAQFENNERQDVKIVSPKRLTDEIFEILKSKGKKIKKEIPLQGEIWKHSNSSTPNALVESEELNYDLGDKNNNIEIAFGHDKSSQDSHYHKYYGKILYSESHINVKYRGLEEKEIREVDLPNGGLIYIAPMVIHLQKFSGITLSMRYPMDADDKVNQEL